MYRMSAGLNIETGQNIDLYDLAFTLMYLIYQYFDSMKSMHKMSALNLQRCQLGEGVRR